DKTLCHPVFTLREYINADDRTSALNLVRVTNADVESEDFALIPMDKSVVFILETNELHGMADQRQFFFKMEELGLNIPVIIKRSYKFEAQDSELRTQDLQLYASTDLGALLVDGFGDG